MKLRNLVEPALPGRYGRMNPVELDAEVAKFEREFIAETAQSLSEEECVRDRRAKRKRGRPVVGNGAKRVLITIESTLLQRSDAYADRHGLTRSALIARGLEALLGNTSGLPRPRKRP